MAAFFQHLKNGFYAAREYNTLKLIPLRQSLAGYQVGYLSGDLRAGLNVALLAFPQGMAYALIAGLPIQYGIYGSAIAAMVAPIFAKSHFITVGPTNATSVMLLSAFASLGIIGAEKLGMAPLLILMVGLFVVIGAYFKVANLVHYISRSVITGYITAAALLIITNQIPKSLGLEMLGKGATFYESAVLMFQSIRTAHWATLSVSLSTACLFVFLNKKFKSSAEMCDDILNKTGVALLPGSDFGFDQNRMLARLSFTDFDGKKFMEEIEDNTKIDDTLIHKLAPKIVEGVDKLKKWSESI